MLGVKVDKPKQCHLLVIGGLKLKYRSTMNWRLTIELISTELSYFNFYPSLKLCFAAAIHNFKWLEITLIRKID